MSEGACGFLFRVVLYEETRPRSSQMKLPIPMSSLHASVWMTRAHVNNDARFHLRNRTRKTSQNRVQDQKRRQTYNDERCPCCHLAGRFTLSRDARKIVADPSLPRAGQTISECAKMFVNWQ